MDVRRSKEQIKQAVVSLWRNPRFGFKSANKLGQLLKEIKGGYLKEVLSQLETRQVLKRGHRSKANAPAIVKVPIYCGKRI